MKIEVWSDFACPFCYIGKTRFDNALNKFEHKDQVEVIYKAYLLNPSAPKVMKGTAIEAFAKGHRVTPEQAKAKFKMFVDNAKSVGLDYNYDIIQMTNTLDAHRIAKWAEQFNKKEIVTSRFMKAYFTDGLSLADHDTLLSLVEELDLDKESAKEVLDSNKFESDVRAEIEEGRSVGVRGVPFFVLNRKYGISGAQQEDYFLESLKVLYKESQSVEPLNVVQGETCDDEGCTI